jgi:hypothetical protein
MQQISSSSSQASILTLPARHPLDAHYYSVVDELQLELVNIWFHLPDQFNRK